MTTPHSFRKVLASVGAVLAGFFATAVLSVGADALLHGTGVFPPYDARMGDGLFALATAYRTVFTVLGGYLTARLAPDRPMRHVVVLGTIGIVAGAAGVAVSLHIGPALGPLWYPVVLLVEAFPCVWLGGWLRERQRAAR